VKDREGLAIRSRESRVADPSGIRCLFDPWIRDGQKSGSGMNNLDHISESLKNIFLVKILKFFDADPGWKKFGSGIKGWKKNSDLGSGSATLRERLENCSQELQVHI
jgi:hypothetical protein